MIWVSGSAVAAALLFVIGLFGLVFVKGVSYFSLKPLYEVSLADGTRLLAQIVGEEYSKELIAGVPKGKRYQIKQANRDDFGIDFRWVDESEIINKALPPGAIVVERLEWGNYHAFAKSLISSKGEKIEGNQLWSNLQREISSVLAVRGQIHDIEKFEIGRLSSQQETLRLEQKREGATLSQKRAYEQRAQEITSELRVLEDKIKTLRESIGAKVVLSSPNGDEKTIPLAEVVRVYRPNAMGTADKALFVAEKLWEFVSEDPRESNTEGGVLPAIFGTVMMVFLMTIFATPVGVLAAIYLREYAKPGKFVSLVRIAVNNLAGVPSIVFGVFGVGFFIYVIGGSIDSLFFSEKLPAPTFGTGGILWASLTLALLTIPTVIVATEEGLASIPKHLREASYALGATKFETTFKVVIPSLIPSILTGMILAVSRAAGEVAPLMITGVVKLAPSMPIDGQFPFLHFDRKFMHLGFHIYDVGFQSPNVDAARPMVFATTLLLLLIVVSLNLSAMIVRNKLRNRCTTSGV
jgi:phosphate transport system permease protein